MHDGEARLTGSDDPAREAPLDPQAYAGLADFRLALRRFLAASEQISRAAGVTQQQYQVLLAIRTGPDEGLTIKALAEQLLLTHHAGVQLVDRLALLGLVERRPAASDGRSVIAALTPAGARLIEQLAGRHLQEILRQERQLTASLQRLRRLGRPPA